MKRIPLTQGLFALVDDEDFDRVNQFKWTAHKFGKQFYADRHILLPSGKRETQLLHNFILGVKGLDHRNGDGLDNQKGNLRSATKQQNARAHRRKISGTTSRFRGVHWHLPLKKWLAQINDGTRKVYIGVFKSERKAALAYDAKAREFFGEFASPNFP